MEQLEQGRSEPSEGEQDLMRMCRQEENCNNRAESQLLHGCHLLFQWSGMSKCGTEFECENI